MWLFSTLVALLLWCVAAVGGAPTTSSAPVAAPTPSTLIDILSANVQYSYFLRHLQRHGMVPLLGGFRNVTLLAPVNLAFAAGPDASFDDSNLLLRYVLDQRLRVGYLGTEDVIVDSLYHHFSRPYSLVVSPDLEAQEYVVDGASIVESDVYAKHQNSFVQAIDRLLPVKPTLCEVLMNSDELHFSFAKGLFRLLFSERYLNSNPKYAVTDIPDTCDALLNKTRTLFLPTDAYVNRSLGEVDRRYYLSLLHSLNSEVLDTTKDAVRETKLDIFNLLQLLMFNDLIGGVNGTSGKPCTSVNGKTTLNVTLDKNKVLVNGKVHAVSSQIYADGIFHVLEEPHLNFFADLGVPTASMVPRKALYAMHYSHFVKEVNFRKMGRYLDGSSDSQTIFVEADLKDDAPDDDALTIAGSRPEIAASGFSSKQALLYQFLDEPIDTTTEGGDREFFHRIVLTKMCSKKRVGSCFRVKMTGIRDKEGAFQTTVNDEIHVIEGPIRAANNTFIYVVDREVAPPLLLKKSLGVLLSSGVILRHLEHIHIDKTSCLSTLGYLNEYDLLLLHENGRGYSVFLPCSTEADTSGDHPHLSGLKPSKGTWDSLGLVLNHLESNPGLFRSVLKGFFVENTVYSDFGLEDDDDLVLISKTLRGDMVNISEHYYSGDFDHTIRLNDTILSIPLNLDILFNQGVVHIIDKVLLPQNFEISVADLLKTTDDKAFPQFSFGSLLEKYPKIADALISQREYSVLVPSPESLHNFNVTSDFGRLLEFLEFHLVPNKYLGLLLECVDGTQSPNSTQDIIFTNHSSRGLKCRTEANGKTYLRLQGTGSAEVGAYSYNKDHEVRILSHGCTTTNKDNGTCVFLLDKPLSLLWLDSSKKNAFLHIHLGFVSVGVGIIIGIFVLGAIMLGVLFCMGGIRTGKPVPANMDHIFAPAEPSFMRVTSDDEELPGGYYDRGYETDDDMWRSDRDRLLPSRGKWSRRHDYGSTRKPFSEVKRLFLEVPAIQPNSGPKNGKVSPKNGKYSPKMGRTSPSNDTNTHPGTAPRSIRGNNIISSLNRERLPGNY